MRQVLEASDTKKAGEVRVKIVDCDIHPLPRSTEELRNYLPAPWRDRAGGLGHTSLSLYLPAGGSYRVDAASEAGPPGSDPELTQRQLFEVGVDFGILIPIVRTYFNPDEEVAMCAAANEWLVDTWLSKYNGSERWRGSITVCGNDPEAAAREIEKWSGHPYMVQVRMNSHVRMPFGEPFYDPIYQAATRAHLPVGVHFTKGTGMSMLSPVGFQSYFFETHAIAPLGYAAHIVSLICNGTFDRFEGLKFVWIEGGYSWCAPLLWRMEHQWRDARSELPRIKRRPRDYWRDNLRWTSQPIEEPPKSRHLKDIMDWAEAERTFLFATDYPHWDYDDPAEIVRRLPAHVRDRVFCENAIETYRLPTTRPA